MNREYKFRGWDKNKKQFIDDFIIALNGIRYRYVRIGNVGAVDNSIGDYYEIDFSDWYGIENIELMQYTGLKDKNNKEIYEGDIISDGWLDDNIGVVEFADGIFSLGIGYPESLSSQAVASEVIGNIYENPDLIGNKIAD